ncbi:hypothetical protein MRX96_007339 [Rhipicephalus microplus]
MNLCDDATFYFIHIVEEFPTLWDLSRADYADVVKKQSVWEHIVEDMKKNWPTYGPYTVEGLKRYFDNKRRTYRLERKKADHTKSAQPASDVYIGRWKFYKALKFLDGAKIKPRRSIMGQDQQNIAETEMPLVFSEATEAPEPAAVDEDATVDEIVAVDKENCTIECVPVAILSTPSTPNTVQAASKKRPRKNQSLPPEEMWTERQKVLEKIAVNMQPMQPPQPDDACDHFGRLVAASMRAIPKKRHLSCQAEILRLMDSYMDL